MNVLMALVQIAMAMHATNSLSNIRGLEECTDSELNRVSDRVLAGIKIRAFSILLSLLVFFVVGTLASELALLCQLVLTVAIALAWWFTIKETAAFEITLIQRQVRRVGRERAVARLLKKQD